MGGGPIMHLIVVKAITHHGKIEDITWPCDDRKIPFKW